MMIPATAFISVCLFGIEELATQLEEPFTILPMQGFCDKIGTNCDEIVSWAGHVQDDERALAAEARAFAAEARALAVERGYEQVSKLQKENRIKRRASMRERLSPIEGQVQISVT